MLGGYCLIQPRKYFNLCEYYEYFIEIEINIYRLFVSYETDIMSFKCLKIYCVS